MSERVRVGISACLLGQGVRWDGGHKRAVHLADALGGRVEWIPVCPEVGSTRVAPGPMEPSRSAASTMDSPIRSLTEPKGLKNSHFARMSASTPSSAASLASRTSGVAPTVSMMLS